MIDPVLPKVTVPDWMDTVTDAEHAPPSVFLGPEFLRHKLYQLSPPEVSTPTFSCTPLQIC